MVAVAAAASAIVLLTPQPSTPSEAAVLPAPEKPWLSREAEAQIFAGPGQLGPLFDGVLLGGGAPTAETRERIAAFARANDLTIDFEIVEDELVAIRLDVTFGGCCGYEGIDLLAQRLGQPNNGGGCGTPKFFYDNWAITHEDGTHVRAAVFVNRLRIRWERSLSFAELAATAESMIGADRGTLADAGDDRWLEIESGKRYLYELPYAYSDRQYQSGALDRERGIQVVTDRRIVTEVTFTTPGDRDKLRARWGKPRVGADDAWTWHRGDRTISAYRDSLDTMIVIAKR